MGTPEAYDGEQVSRRQLAASSKTAFGDSLAALEALPRWQRVHRPQVASLASVQLDLPLDLVECMLAAGVDVETRQLPLVDLEARPDLGHHLSIQLELLLAQLVVAQLVALQPAVGVFGIENAHAPLAGDVLARLRRRQVRLDILL